MPQKSGEKKTVTGYLYQYNATLTASYKVVDPNGKILDSYKTTANGVVKTKAYRDVEFLKENRYGSINPEEKKKLAKRAIRELMNKAKTKIPKRFAYRSTKDKVKFYYIAKHDSEKGFSKNLATAKSVFEAAAATDSPAVLKEKLTPVFEFWQQYADAEPTEDKGQKKIYKAANLNLAKAHFFLDEFNKGRGLRQTGGGLRRKRQNGFQTHQTDSQNKGNT